VGEAAARTAVGRRAAVGSLSAMKSSLNQEGVCKDDACCAETMATAGSYRMGTIHLVNSKEQREQQLVSSFLLCFYLSVLRFSKYAENVGIIIHC